MKNKYIIVLSSIVILGGTFAAGVKASSIPGWLTQYSIDGANKIDAASKSKTDALLSNIQQQIQSQAGSKLNAIIDQKTSDAQNQIQAYFDSKVTDLTNTPDYQAEVSDLDRVENNIVANYKAKIDAALSGQQ